MLVSRNVDQESTILYAAVAGMVALVMIGCQRKPQDLQQPGRVAVSQEGQQEQDENENRESSNVPSGILGLIPRQCVAALVLRPQKLAEAGFGDLVEPMIMMFDQLYKPTEVKQIVWYITSDRSDSLAVEGFAFTLAEGSTPQRILNSADLKSSEYKGRAYFSVDGERGIYAPDDQTVVIASIENIRQILDGRHVDGALRKILSKADPDSEFISCSIHDYANFFAPFHLFRPTSIWIGSLPLPEEALKKLPSGATNWGIVELQLTEGLQANVVLEAADEFLAKEIEMICQQVGRDLRDSLPHVRDRLQAAFPAETVEAATAVADSLAAGVSMQRTGKTIQIDIDPTMEAKQFIGQLQVLKQSVTASDLGRELDMALREVAQENRLKDPEYQLQQVLVAMLNHRDGFRHFPTDIRDEEGRPLLSWRVKILPLLDQYELYEQFRLNEPWDSPHNLALLEQMPAIYGPPNASGETLTRYLVPFGEGAVFQESVTEPRSSDIQDGLGNTIILLRVAPEQAIEWTKPADLSFQPDQPRKSLGATAESRFLVGFADGKVRAISSNTPAEMIRRLIQQSDGEEVRLLPSRN